MEWIATAAGILWWMLCGSWFAASFRHTGRDNIIEPRFCQNCGKAVSR